MSDERRLCDGDGVLGEFGSDELRVGERMAGWWIHSAESRHAEVYERKTKSTKQKTEENPKQNVQSKWRIFTISYDSDFMYKCCQFQKQK